MSLTIEPSNVTLYRRLISRHIRVIELLPDEHSKMIRCRLIETDLDRAPPFEALSYVWGNLKATTEIKCNGQEYHVRVNLWLALQRLRHQNVSRFLWVDAVCINQQDLQERGEQVLLMHDIYSLASNVVVWLGAEDDHETEKAIYLMQHITSTCKKYAEQIGIELRELALDPVGFSKVDIQRDILINQTTNDSSYWNALRQFFARQWFTRVWCVQEIFFAHKSTVLCGQSEVTWTDIGVCASWLNCVELEQDFQAPPIVQGMSYFNALCMFDCDYKEKFDLVEALSRFRDFSATDPRDKVYGLLGIVKGNGGQPAVEVNYKKSYQEVYIDTARAIVGKNQDLSVLSLVKHGRTYDTKSAIPSWVPCWDSSSEEMSFWDESSVWNTCGGNKLLGFEVSNHDSVSLKGVVFDNATSLSDIMGSELFSPTGPSSANNPFLDLWHECSADKPSHPEKQIALVLMAETLTGGMSIDYIPIGNLEKEDQYQFYSDFLAFMQQQFTFAGLTPKTAAPREMAIKKGNWETYRVAASRASDERRFFQTSRGFYGLGPPCMEKGDLVVVLFGGAVPFILRPVNTHYVFIGECFVCDIMYGQLFENDSDGDLKYLGKRQPEQVFVLQ